SLQWGFGYLQPRLVSYPTLRAWLVTLEDVFRCLNPLYVLQPAWASADPGEFARRLAVAFFAYGSLGAGWTALAVWQFRPVSLRQIQGVRRTTRKVPKRAPVHDDPVRWKEGLTRSRVARWAGVAGVALLSGGVAYWLIGKRDPWLFVLEGVAAA